MKMILMVVLTFSLIFIACDSDSDCPTPVPLQGDSELDARISDLEEQLISDYNVCEAKILEQETTISSLEWKLEQAVEDKSEPSPAPSAAEKPIVFKRRSVTSAGFIGISGDVDLMTLKIGLAS